MPVYVGRDLQYVRVCVTGKIEGYTRDRLAREIADAGGSFDESIKPITDYLVIGERPGATKVLAARRMGIETRDADWLIASLSYSHQQREVEEARGRIAKVEQGKVIEWDADGVRVLVDGEPITGIDTRTAPAPAQNPVEPKMIDRSGKLVPLPDDYEIEMRPDQPVIVRVDGDVVGFIGGIYTQPAPSPKQIVRQKRAYDLPIYETPGELPEGPLQCELDRETGIVWVFQGGRRIGRMASAIEMGEVIRPKKDTPQHSGEVARIVTPAPAARSERGARPIPDPLAAIRKRRGERQW